MSNTTESPFSYTLKVGRDNALLTGRANTALEMVQRIDELGQLEALITEKQGVVIAPPLQGVPQAVAQPQPVVAPDVQQAVANIAAAGLTGQVIQGTLEQKDDRFGGKYIRGMPDAGGCAHGGRIHKNWITKNGAAKQAFVCVNDSPFGDWKQDKCEIEWAN